MWTFGKGAAWSKTTGLAFPQLNFRRQAAWESCTVRRTIPGFVPYQKLGLTTILDTSKFDSLDEVYGRKGIFLHSLAALALVSITSCHVSQSSTNSITYHHSNTISRLCPAPIQHGLVSEHGTKVTVTNLFGNLPVRVKHRALTLQRDEDIDKEWDVLKSSLVGLIISSGKAVKVMLEDATKTRRMVNRGRQRKSSGPELSPILSSADKPLDIPLICSILSQAGYLTSADSTHWATASARASGISIKSAISLSPSPSKQVQFISFGINPLTRHSSANVLYDEINRLFAASSFGTDDSETPEIAENLQKLDLEGPWNAPNRLNEPKNEKMNKARAKGVSRWPMFYIRINLKGQRIRPEEKDNPLASEKSLADILAIITAMIRRFLEQYHFTGPRHRRPKKRNQDVSSPSNQENWSSKKPRSCNAVAPHSAPTSNAVLALEEFLRPQAKLPNFSRLSRPPSTLSRGDFANWSRVKAGNPNSDIMEELRSGLPRKKNPSLALSSSKHEDDAKPAENETSLSLSSRSAPLSELLNTSSALPIRVIQSPAASEHVSLVGNEELDLVSEGLEDNVIQWVNPMTKETLCINERTGQTLSSKSTRSTPCCSPGSFSTPWKPNSQDINIPKPTPWFDAVLKDWENPVFRTSERPIPMFKIAHPEEERVNSSSDRLATLNSDTGTSSVDGRLTKSGLANSELIAQVHNQFLLLKVDVPSKDTCGLQRLLVLVDQHAADERIRIEQLFDELCGSSSSQPVATTFLQTPIKFKVSAQEAQLFSSRSDYFTSWGCHYSIIHRNGSQHPVVEITALPTLIYERCRNEPKLVIEMLRAEVWSSKDDSLVSKPRGSLLENLKRPDDMDAKTPRWLHLISHCPRGIVELLNSRACRSAIMFNDELKREDCEQLISNLAKCTFPFYCAHGRPSMVPIVSLGPVGDHYGDRLEQSSDFGRIGSGDFGAISERDHSGFVGAFKAWMRTSSS